MMSTSTAAAAATQEDTATPEVSLGFRMKELRERMNYAEARGNHKNGLGGNVLRLCLNNSGVWVPVTSEGSREELFASAKGEVTCIDMGTVDPSSKPIGITPDIIYQQQFEDAHAVIKWAAEQGPVMDQARNTTSVPAAKFD